MTAALGECDQHLEKRLRPLQYALKLADSAGGLATGDGLPQASASPGFMPHMMESCQMPQMLLDSEGLPPQIQT